MLELRQVDHSALYLYGQLKSAFDVKRVLRVAQAPDGQGLVLHDEAAADPYSKDYDTLDGQAPRDWPSRFPVERWGIFIAVDDKTWLGAMAIVSPADALTVLTVPPATAVVWDLRVATNARRKNIGSTLLRTAMTWAKERGAKRLAAETQNVNVAACQFYRHNGFELISIERFAYPTLPQESRLVWCCDIGSNVAR